MSLPVLLFVLMWMVSLNASAQSADCMIDQDQSLMQIYVLKEGPLSAFGDNHIISTASLAGRIRFDPAQPENSDIDLTIPVNSLIVNDPDLRARASEQFQSRVSSFNRRFTRYSMLGPKVLDAEKYPEINVVFEQISGTLPSLDAELKVTLHGQTSREQARINLAYQDSRMITIGELTLSQKRYGIKPFSILFGAIRVQDQLRLNFNIAADCHLPG